jgi:hypothetical protein
MHNMVEQLPTPAGTPSPHVEPVRDVKSKKSLKNQSKPLLFINHDAKHLKSQATRSEVTSHLRSAYQPWKHRMQARARREAGQSIVSSKPSNDSTGNDKDLFSKTITIRRLNTKYQSHNQSSSSEEDDIDSLPTPHPFLHQGNSDPFSALSLKITPLIAELIKFEHAHLHPCIYSTKNTPSRAYGTSYLADMHGPTESQAAIYGYLSRAATVLSTVSTNPQFKTAALVLKGRSSALLRAQLATGKSNPDILRKILALMIAELFAHEYEAALVHSRILFKLLKERSESVDPEDEFDMRFFFSVVYSEVQRSCMSLTKPCFDTSASGWVARLFESVGGDAFRSLVKALNIDDKPLQPSVLGLELSEIFGEVRTVRIVSQEYSNSPVYGTPTPLALYLPARVVLCLGRMVRFFMDHCAGRNILDLLPRELIHRAAVLGALYWVRKAGHIDSIRVSSTSTIYTAGPMILAKLRESVERFDGIASDAERELYGDLRFWVLYIGAQEEQGRVQKGEIVLKWFTTRLVESSRDIGVYTWQQARPILERYPHPDAAEPHGSTWFSGIFAHIPMVARNDGIDANSEPRKPRAGLLPYGTGDDYMAWCTEEPMTLGKNMVGVKDTTCAKLKQSIRLARAKEATFVCPTWDMGQDCGLPSGSPSLGMLEADPDLSLGSDMDGNGAFAGTRVAFATRPDMFDFDFSSEEDITSNDRSREHTQDTEQSLATNISQIDIDDPVTGWIGEQQQQTWSQKSKPKPTSQPESHLFHSDAKCWQQNSAAGKAEARAEVHSYTPLTNDPKLTGIETGPVAFASYPSRKLNDVEALTEARRYEFF